MKQKDARGRFLGAKKNEKSAHTVCHEITSGFFGDFFSNKVVAKVVRGMN